MVNACREFYEETGGVLQNDVMNTLLGALRGNELAAINTTTANITGAVVTSTAVSADAGTTVVNSCPPTMAAGISAAAIPMEVCWLPCGKYALYLVHADSVVGLAAATADIEQQFVDFKNSPRYATAPHDFKEMDELRWVSVSELRQASTQRNEFLKKVLQDDVFKKWIMQKSAKPRSSSSSPKLDKHSGGKWVRNQKV